MIVLDEVPAYLLLTIATVEHSVWQDDGHDAIGLDVVEVVEEEGEVRLTFRS